MFSDPATYMLEANGTSRSKNSWNSSCSPTFGTITNVLDQRKVKGKDKQINKTISDRNITEVDDFCTI